MLLAWLVAEKNVPLQVALRFLVGLRPAVCPNAKFLTQLGELEVMRNYCCLDHWLLFL